MVITKMFIRASLKLALILFTNISLAQKNTSTKVFSQFNGFKKLGLHSSGMLYFPAKLNKQYGNHVLNTHFAFCGRFGFDYIFNPKKRSSLRTGLFFDLIPLYKYSYIISRHDLPIEYQDYPLDVSDKDLTKLNLTIPLSYTLKKQIGLNKFLGLNIGGEFMLMSNGGFSSGYALLIEKRKEGREIFSMYANTTLEEFWIYPSLKISPEFYILRKKIIYLFSITYKKSLVNYFKGEYQFGNLEVSSPTRGTYKLSGDYLSLEMTVFFKKKKKPKITVIVK